MPSETPANNFHFESKDDFDFRLDSLKELTLKKLRRGMNYNFALSEAIVELFSEIFPKFENPKENNTYTDESFSEQLDKFIKEVKTLKGGTNYRFSTALEKIFPEVFKGSNY